MLKIDGNLFKGAVESVAKSAKRSRLAQSYIFVEASAKSNELTLSIVGETIQVQKKLVVNTKSSFSFATTVQELEFKTLVIPEDEELTIEPDHGHYLIRWGRASQLVLLTTPESVPTIEFPNVISSIVLPPGKVSQISRMFGGFPALMNSDAAKEMPILTGISFVKTDTDEVVLQASNRVRAIRDTDTFDWFDGLQSGIPSEAINSLSEIIDSTVEVNVALSENQNLLIFETGSVKAIVRLQNDKFPDTSNIYSDERAPILWRADRMELLQIARRIKRLGTTPFMKIYAEGAKAYAELEGVLKEQIGAVAETSIKEGFTVNAIHAELALSVLRGDEVLIAFKAPLAPLTFLSGDEESSEKVKIMAAQKDAKA